MIELGLCGVLANSAQHWGIPDDIGFLDDSALTLIWEAIVKVEVARYNHPSIFNQ